ncbi:MAG: hypothetical protein CR991_09135 [Proteobacteria bacterium]|nr:MAG: hypothetical protein CR991_09135 [Pseudomonadota bacterium]
MDAFLHYNLMFPVVFYGGLLVLVVLFWLSNILGIMDIDMLDGDVEFDADVSSSAGASWLSRFKVEGIPLTVSLSLLILFSWALCFVGAYFIYPRVQEEWLQILIGFWLWVLAPVVGIQIVAPLMQPLRPLFRETAVFSPESLLGEYATVRSGKVSASFGEATFEDGGAGMLLKIRAEEPNDLRPGAQVRLISFDPVTHSYQVLAAP